jgi:hypothetical protein
MLKDVPELTSLTTILIYPSWHQQVKIWPTLFTTIPICVPLGTSWPHFNQLCQQEFQLVSPLAAVDHILINFVNHNSICVPTGPSWPRFDLLCQLWFQWCRTLLHLIKKVAKGWKRSVFQGTRVRIDSTRRDFLTKRTRLLLYSWWDNLRHVVSCAWHIYKCIRHHLTHKIIM